MVEEEEIVEEEEMVEEQKEDAERRKYGFFYSRKVDYSAVSGHINRLITALFNIIIVLKMTGKMFPVSYERCNGAAAGRKVIVGLEV